MFEEAVGEWIGVAVMFRWFGLFSVVKNKTALPAAPEEWFEPTAAVLKSTYHAVSYRAIMPESVCP